MKTGIDLNKKQTIVRKYLLGLLMFCGFSWQVRGAVVDTLWIHSEGMDKEIQTVVISPGEGKATTPVIYLLHGHGGNAKSWVDDVKPDLPELADLYGICLVCPDAQNSWYWDSPRDSSSRYETFVCEELIRYVEARYPVVKECKGRAITGYSMGGHGAMWIALRHTSVFGAAGSICGGVDLRPFPDNWNLKEHLGEENKHREIWEKHTVINQVDRLKNGDLALIFDCGYDDFFFEVNNDFHEKLLKYKIDHDFIVRPGAHTNDYCRKSIDYQLLFFKKYFDKNKNK